MDELIKAYKEDKIDGFKIELENYYIMRVIVHKTVNGNYYLMQYNLDINQVKVFNIDIGDFLHSFLINLKYTLEQKDKK